MPAAHASLSPERRGRRRHVLSGTGDATLGFASKEHSLIGAYISPVDWSKSPPLAVGRVAISRSPGAVRSRRRQRAVVEPHAGRDGSTDQPQLAVAPRGRSSQFVVGATTHDTASVPTAACSGTAASLSGFRWPAA